MFLILPMGNIPSRLLPFIRGILDSAEAHKGGGNATRSAAVEWLASRTPLTRLVGAVVWSNFISSERPIKSCLRCEKRTHNRAALGQYTRLEMGNPQTGKGSGLPSVLQLSVLFNLIASGSVASTSRTSPQEHHMWSPRMESLNE